MRSLVRQHPGDALAGEKVFKRVCAQCHKIYGEGVEVGPDVTSNGRNSFEQLLSNVFDPNLVIGAAYRAHTVATTEGRVLTGLLVEETPQRVILKIQGGKLETIPRADIELMKASEVSMMPEELEKQAKPQEIADLFAFLTLDKHPSDPQARQLPGVRQIKNRQATNPREFASVLAEVAPGFNTSAVGRGGMMLLAEHFNRPAVVRTHPVRQGQPCILRRTVDLPSATRSRLLLAVSHHPDGDWRLRVKANGDTLLDTLVSSQITVDGWAEYSVDLSKLAGRQVKLELHNHPNNWQNEYGFWGRVEVVSE